MKRVVGVELIKVREAYLKMEEEVKRLGVKEDYSYYWRGKHDKHLQRHRPIE